MSSQTNVVFNGSNQLQSQTSLAKLVLFGQELKTFAHTNSAYYTETLRQGTVMGVVAETGEIVPFKSTNVNGSQYPIGILAFERTVEVGDTTNLPVLIRGDIRAGMLNFDLPGDSLTTMVSYGGELRRVGDILEDRFILRDVSNATTYDNEIN